MGAFTDDSWLHAYGVVNGLFIAAICYMVFFGISSLINRGRSYIAITFMLLAWIGILFTGYSLFFQVSYDSLSAQNYPDWLVNLCKYAAPLALIFSSEVFLKNFAIKSYDTYAVVKKAQPLRYGLLVINLFTLVLLFFTPSVRWAMVIIQLMFIPSIIAGIIINYLSPYRSLSFTGALIFSLIACIAFGTITTLNKNAIPQSIILVMLITYATILLLLSFAVIRYGFDEAIRFNEIKEVDASNLSDDLYAAIKDAQFFLVYQPKICLKNNRTMGFEALIRWQHPKKGVIRPAQFIELSEKTHMIDNITEWVIDSAIQQAKVLMQHGYQTPLSINMSAMTIKPDMMTYLAERLAHHQVPASMLIVEIKESLLVTHASSQMQALDMLHRLGVRVSLDDYGTGFSSLSFIRSLGINELKIDTSFVANLNTHPDSLVIVKSTLQMSRGLKLPVVAEGVETDDVKQTLTELGCDTAQGYAISHPLKQNDLLPWLENETSRH